MSATHNEGDALQVERVSQILRVRICRPAQRNALSLAVLDSLREVFESSAANENIRCAVITGTGDRSFAAGGDLKELDALRSDTDAARVEAVGRRALDAIRDFPAPVIAALNGPALGGGAELALACDFRVALATASIGFLQGKLAITTAWGGGSDLMALLGTPRALALLLTSRIVTAAEAYTIGLFDAVVQPQGTLDEAVSTYIAQWDSKPVHVIRAFTAVARAARRSTREAARATERNSILETWVHQAHWAASEAALEKYKQ